MRRVVVTGCGLVTPIGTSVESAWSALLAGKTGTVSLVGRGNGAGKFEGGFDKLPCTVAAVVEGLNEYERRRDHVVRATHFAALAASEALGMSGWAPKTANDRSGMESTGVSIGVGMSSVDEVASTAAAYSASGLKSVSPFFVPRILPNLAAGHLSILHGFMGPNHSVSTACATGLHSIGDAFRFIKACDADVMLCGGAESCIDPLSIGAFARMRAVVSTFNDRPSEASRPFDISRGGFVMGEGAGMLVLEELGHAKKRGARILAEVSGYGMSGDATHITTPGGDGARLAMQRALREATMEPRDIGYVNTHATSTPLGDQIETNAIKAVFGDHAKEFAVSSSKGAIGHLLGAAGAVEAIFTVLALNRGILPPTANLHSTSPEMDLNYIPRVPLERTVDAALKNSFGFGGTNASMVFKRYQE